LNTCQDKPDSPHSPSISKILLYTLIPVFAVIVILCVLSMYVRKRRLALIRQAQNKVITTVPVYTIQNANVSEESAPQAHSEAATNESANLTNENALINN